MKARHEFRPEAERLWDVDFDYPYIKAEATEPPKDKEKWIEAKTDELYYNHLRDYAAIHIQSSVMSSIDTMGIIGQKKGKMTGQKATAVYSKGYASHLITELKKEG